MTRIIATNVTSPLGLTTEQNSSVLSAGHASLRGHRQWKGLPLDITASVFSPEQIAGLAAEGFTRFEAMVLHSVRDALSQTSLDITSGRSILVLATTLGNVEELVEGRETYTATGEAAKKIALALGMTTEPLVVCNACISGAQAQLMAERLIRAGVCDHAIVCGADCVTPFTVAGFSCLKVLSPAECRPFDIERLGLNLGEAAATIIFSKEQSPEKECWTLLKGCADNDCHHISTPSPTGDGVLRCIRETLAGFPAEALATVNLHGTGSMFNDQMESKAIESAGLSELPASAIKGIYGHTMGASGLLEAILAMRALDEGKVLPTRGFSEAGVSGRVSLSASMRATDKKSLLKLSSGFGGGNCVLLYTKDAALSEAFGNPGESTKPQTVCLHRVRISPDGIMLDGSALDTTDTGAAMLTEAYKKYVGDFPKFYKMDPFSRLTMLACSLLMGTARSTAQDGDRCGILLFNRSGSILQQRRHIESIKSEEGFYPSPAIFIYTLPNIVMGEIAIKYGFKGETSLYILGRKDEGLMSSVREATIHTSGLQTLITGWVECDREDDFEADFELLTIS